MPFDKTQTQKNRGQNKKNNFKPRITIGLIYADWCGHCQALKPEWKKMKKLLKDKHFIFAEIEDSDPNKDIKISDINKRLQPDNQLSADGYPTIFRISNNHLEKYSGERTADALITWFKNDGANKTEENKMLFGGKQNIKKHKNYRLRSKKSSISLKKRRKKSISKSIKTPKSLKSDLERPSDKLPISLTSTVLRMNGGCGCDKTM